MKRFLPVILAIIFFNFFSCQKKNEAANIILITIDTLRADHLSCYGYYRNTSPKMDKIAKGGVLFQNAIASSSFTPPSMATIFTSKNPSSHGVKHGVFNKGNVYNQEVLLGSFVTLAEVLKGNGYATFGFHTNPHLSSEFGFAQGFDFFKQYNFVDAKELNTEVLKFKEKIESGGKYFLWVHYFDPHWPYFKREPWISSYSLYNGPVGEKGSDIKMWPEKFAEKMHLKEDKNLLSYMVARYDSEINFVDKYVGELINSFKNDSHTLLIITSDHGEEFFEHGDFTHGFQLYEESIRVPLIINFPSKIPEGMKVQTQVGIIDIMPTILDILDIKTSNEFEGKSIIPLISQNKKGERILYSELYRFGKKLVCARFKNCKYIYNIKENKEEFYDLNSDPNEKSNIISKNEIMVVGLREGVKALVSSSKGLKTKEKPVGRDVLEDLRSLGYIN